MLLFVTSVACLTFTMQNRVCAKFDSRKLVLQLSAGGEFLCAHLKSRVKDVYVQAECGDITTSLEISHGPICSLHKCNVKTESLQCADTEKLFYFSMNLVQF